MAELNGEPVTPGQLLSLALTNYGHFTSMLVEDQRVRGLSLHLERLARDARRLFDFELDTERVRSHVRHAVDGVAQAVVTRVTLFDPQLDLSNIGGQAEPSVLVTTRPAPTAPPAPWRLQAASYRREIPQVKHIGLFGALQLRRAAQLDGYDDVLFLDPDGTVSEVATSNIGFIQDGQVIWPRSEYLTGVTMTLLNQARDEPVTTKRLGLTDLTSMDAAFATNASTGVRSVVSVDNIQWPDGHPVIAELREQYADIPGERL